MNKLKNRQRYRRANIISLIVCVVSLFVIGMLVRKIILDDRREQAVYTFSGGTETQGDGAANAAGSETAAVSDGGAADGSLSDTANDAEKSDSQALPDYYEKRYLVGTPVMYSEYEIQTKLSALSESDDAFAEIYAHMDKYPEALLNNLCNNPNMIDFARGYLDNYDKTSGSLEESELEAAVPLFIQWDPRWGYAAYGNDVVGLSGCGPTCLSMVIVGLTKNAEATPDVLADYATEHGYYEDGSGTKWSFMEEAGAAYGVQSSSFTLNKDMILEELSKGHPLICAMHAGDFTAQGHFIVLAGTEDGLIRVFDPNSMERSQKLWDYETLSSQISGLWVFTRADAY